MRGVFCRIGEFLVLFLRFCGCGCEWVISGCVVNSVVFVVFKVGKWGVVASVDACDCDYGHVV